MSKDVTMSCESNVILESPRPQFARSVLYLTDFGGDVAFFDDKHTNFMVHVVAFFPLAQQFSLF